MSIKIKKREEVSDKYKWRLEDIYENDDLWELDLVKYEELAKDFEKYKGNIIENSNLLYQAIKIKEKLDILGGKLFLYAQLRFDENMKMIVSKKKIEKFNEVDKNVANKIAFFTHELKNLTTTKLEIFLNNSKDLKEYGFYLKGFMDFKKHELIKDNQNEYFSNIQKINALKNKYNKLVFSDIEYNEAIIVNGIKINLNSKNYNFYIKHKNQDVRKATYDLYITALNEEKNKIFDIFKELVFLNDKNANLFGYKSAFEKKCVDDKINQKMVSNMIEAVNYNLDKTHRYKELKKKAIMVSEMNSYDISLPISPDNFEEIKYEQAQNMIFNALNILGEDYCKILKEIFDSRWIDVFPADDKKQIQSNSKVKGVHSFMCLNYLKDFHSLLVFAHEIGHAVNYTFIDNAQPIQYSSGLGCLSEVPSMVNEILLLKYIILNSEDVNLRKKAIGKLVTIINATIFEQSKNLEFELDIHEKILKFKSIDVDEISEINNEYRMKYDGYAQKTYERGKYGWLANWHLFNKFFGGYKYMLGVIAALGIVESIEREGQPAVERYIEFLSAGSSDYPMKLLKKAGIDISSSESTQRTLDFYANILDEFEKLLKI